ncbi:CvpA family protein [Lachnospiraceae bacterium ZAX-1]
MKKIFSKFILGIIIILAAFIYYYVALPPINIHSLNTWWFIILFIIILSILAALHKNVKDYRSMKDSLFGNKINLKDLSLQKIGFAKYGFILASIIFIILIIGSILSSPIVNAAKYQKLMTVKERNFTADITQADFNTVPILDKASASILGNRKMGSMVDMVSQFEVSEDYTQINVNNRPVRVTPLAYASAIKWITNQSSGIPAYIKIDMATQDTECIQLENSIRYSKSEIFNHNIYRHLRFNFPTYIFDDQIFFEIDDEGIPYWICPVKKFSIGLFGGHTVQNVVICNAISGACTVYDINHVPQWIDKVFQAELLMELYDYSGTLKHGYFNSILGQRDCLQTTNGYNYIALDDDVWVYSGVTSVSGDQSNVGFVLMNQRTMETRFYKIEGATEESAMSSAEGQVQHLGYQSTFPLLLNISNEPTYFMALKDDAGLVKQYAMVNIQKYQWVATGDTIKECEKSYNELLSNNGISAIDSKLTNEINGTISNIISVIIDGNSHIYFTIDGKEEIFDVDITNTSLLNIIRYKEGDNIKFTYTQGDIPVSVVEIK